MGQDALVQDALVQDALVQDALVQDALVQDAHPLASPVPQIVISSGIYPWTIQKMSLNKLLTTLNNDY